MHKSFKTLGPLGCHGQNWSLMTRAKSIKFIVTCVPLWKAKKKYWPPNWTVSWNTKTITRPRSLGPRLCKWFFLHQRLCHAKNEQCYIAINRPSVLDHLQADVPFEQRRKYVQFLVIYHLLANGHPIIDYESLRNLFQLLKVKFVSWKHWIDRYN